MSSTTDPADNGVEPTARRQPPERSDDNRRMTRTLRLGAKGGAIATAVMTLFRMPITDSLPPTAEFWAEYLGNGDPAHYPIQALVLHLLYGIAGATAFTAAVERRLRGPEVHTERQGTILATLYGLGMSAFGTRVVLERLLGLDLAPDERWIFHVSHAIYGLTLGAWLGSKL